MKWNEDDKKNVLDIYTVTYDFCVICISSFNVNISFRSAANHLLNNEKEARPYILYFTKHVLVQ